MLREPELSKEGVYVIHVLKGYELHEQRIRRTFKTFDLSHAFITEGDPSLFTNDVLNAYFIPGIKEKLQTGILSCTLNHFFAYEALIKDQLSYAIVFENDPFFMLHFTENLHKFLEERKQLPPGHIISLENSTLRFPSFFQKKKGKCLYKARSGRMAGAYIIDHLGAQKILEYTKKMKCNNVIDWWHNHLIDEGIVDMYWAHPPIVEQGSHNGRMQGAISTKSKSVFRLLAWEIQKFYKSNIGRLRDQKDIY
ncbi:MAG: glycosyltransferase family 25 protein [Saprospiraceae bacterium]|nr:glycosyltransferase family 25 protein [Saprospiraceae bacterium]